MGASARFDSFSTRFRNCDNIAEVKAYDLSSRLAAVEDKDVVPENPNVAAIISLVEVSFIEGHRLFYPRDVSLAQLQWTFHQIY